MDVIGRRHLVVFASVAVAMASVGACRDQSVAPKQVAPPVDQMANLGTTIVDVNLQTGRVVSYPVGLGSPPSGIDASFFGATGTIHHVFQLQGGAPTAGNTYILRDHIENVFPYSIGTHLHHALGVFPEDTIGVFVFMSIQPVVIAGCTAGPTCTVKADSGYDGAFPFTSGTPQQFMYFKTILEPADAFPNQGLDFTDQSPANGGTGIDYFRTFAFRASPGVTNFKFGVSVSAAREKPNDTRWKVTYVGDSLPIRVGNSLADLRSEPDWRVHGGAAAVSDTSIVTSGCAGGSARCLRIVSASPSASDSISFFRSDSLGTSDSAYIVATLNTSNTPNDIPVVFVGMQDRVKLISFGISNNKVGLCDAANTFLPATASPSSVTSWRIAKFAADSVVIYGDGTRVLQYTYSALPAAPVASAPNPFFWFGNRASTGTNVTSLWSSVVYEIGATTP